MGVALDIGARELGMASIKLDRLQRRFGDLTPLMDRIGALLVTTTDERFEREVDPQGKPWKPSTRAKLKGGQTLTDSGRGRSSITHVPHRDSVEVGTNVGYMAAHQEGATIRPKTAKRLVFNIPGIGFRSASKVILPKREFLGISISDRRDIEDLVSAYAEEAVQ